MRIEQTQDVERIRPLAERWFGESRLRDFGLPVTLDGMVAEQNDWLEKLPGVILLAWDGEELVGFLSLFAVSYCDTKMALAKYWYAVPNKVKAGPALYRAGNDWAREMGCSHFVQSASMMMPDSHDKICAFCERMGMRKWETSFVAQVN